MTNSGEMSCCPTQDGLSEPVDSTVSAYLANLFDTGSYPARWNCGNWSSLEGWLHIFSDTAIFAAYFAIPLMLVYYVRRHAQVPYRNLLLLFSAFILSCGTGHLLEAVIFYWPVYRLAGLVKLATALVSWATVVALVFIIPKALRIERIAQANDRLVRMDQAKTQFLANMSHEIRSPMTAILGYADLIYQSESETERRDYAVTIQRNGEYLLTILNDILDLSKIEAGRLEVESIPYSPKDVVEEVLELQRIRTESKGLELHSQISDDIPDLVLGDPVRLRQVLLNLVGNAIKFTNAGNVSLRTRRVLDPDPYLEFEVTDTGIGMTDAQLETLFQPFHQADSSTTRKYGGTGLGLAICDRLVRLMGGSINVESRAGQGSTFRVRLPLRNLDAAHSHPGDRAADHKASLISDSSLDPSKEKAAVTEPSATTQKDMIASLDGITVLLAEDGRDNQHLIKTLLQRAGATVLLAEHGEMVIEILWRCDTPPDVILMDMQMPILDGYEATRRLREQGNSIPIIALTAHAMATDRAKCLAAGCDEYLTKPIRRAELIDTIARFSQSPPPGSQAD